MDNLFLLKISLSISLSGILLLLILANIFEPKLIRIESINPGLLNRKVKIQGEVCDTKIYSSEFQVIALRDRTGEIKIVIDKPIDSLLNQNLTVIGAVEEYENSLQIRADQILR